MKDEMINTDNNKIHLCFKLFQVTMYFILIFQRNDRGESAEFSYKTKDFWYTLEIVCNIVMIINSIDFYSYYV